MEDYDRLRRHYGKLEDEELLEENGSPTPELVEHVKINRGQLAAMLHAAEESRRGR